MGFAYLKEEDALRIDPSIVAKYLNVSELCVGKRETKYVEVIRLNQKLTIEGNPYLSFALKDIHGRVIHASMFDNTIDEESMRILSKCKRVYAKAEYEPVLLKRTIHLQISNIVFVDSTDVSSELADAFTPIYKEAPQMIENIFNTDFGKYNVIIKDVFEKAGMFKVMNKLVIEEYGSAKLGYIAKVIWDLFRSIDSFCINKELAKAVSLYVLVLYAAKRPVASLGMRTNTGEMLHYLYTQTSVLKSQLGTDYEAVTSEFSEESERVLLGLLDLNTKESVTSLMLGKLLRLQRDATKIYAISNSTQKGALMYFEGKEVWNI